MNIATVQPAIDWAMALIGSDTGNPIGDSQAPAAVATMDDPFPYGVIHHINSSRWGAPFTSPDQHLDLIIQVDGIGRRQDQARFLSDRARTVLLERDDEGRFTHDNDAVIAPGWRVADRGHDSGPMPPIPEGEPPDRVFTIVERFLIRIVATQGDQP